DFKSRRRNDREGYRSLIFVFIFILILVESCGHKTALNPPPPKRLAPIENLAVEVGCNQINLKWNPVIMTQEAEIIKSQPQYLVFRRRGEKINAAKATPAATPVEKTPASLQTAPSPTINRLPDPIETSLYTPGATPTVKEHFSPDYDFKLIAIVSEIRKDRPAERISVEPIRFSDNGFPGIAYTPEIKFKKPKGFPPKKMDSDIDLVPGYTYYYKVQAFSQEGLTSEPSEIYEIPFNILPGAPIITNTHLDPDFVELTWTPPEKSCLNTQNPDIAGYFIERTEVGDSEQYLVIGSTDKAATNTYKDGTYTVNKQYRYRVKAYTTLGKIPGVPSEAIIVDTEDIFPPSAPTEINVAASSTGIHIVWSKSPESDVAGYRIYRSVDVNGPFICLNEPVLVQGTFFTDTTAQNEKTYYYAVASVDDTKNANESKLSDIKKIIVP
ncbi:hypothetical protein JW979_04345, partial [bacterium]|nr:hypothetical protein [candidate division CSSED10-310 bacterium]